VPSAETLVRVGVKMVALPLGAASRRQAGDVVILCYHRVADSPREIDVPPARFADQLDAVSSGGRVRSLDDALSGSEGGVVLTFDDGFRDFHDVVLPALVERGMPALLYLATGFVDVGDPRTGIGPDGALSWTMLEEATSTGLVTVASHTHDHVDLSKAGDAEAEEQMRRSKELIEDRLGRSCTHFAYPWGRASAASDAVARRTFRSAALDSWRTNRRDRLDAHRLGRTPVFRSDSDVFIRAKARGQLDAEGYAYRLLRKGPWAPS
jgi:peptidoglycan/xylan/chitin deacetylase (PgdA/CDA1 family)